MSNSLLYRVFGVRGYRYNVLSARLPMIFSEFPTAGKSAAIVIRRQAEQVQ